MADSSTLEIVSVDPVENVQSSIRSQGKQVVRCDGLSLAGFLDHKELGQNSNGFQIDGECPEDFHKAKFVVEHKSQNGGGTQEKFDPEKLRENEKSCIF